MAFYARVLLLGSPLEQSALRPLHLLALDRVEMVFVFQAAFQCCIVLLLILQGVVDILTIRLIQPVILLLKGLVAAPVLVRGGYRIYTGCETLIVTMEALGKRMEGSLEERVVIVFTLWGFRRSIRRWALSSDDFLCCTRFLATTTNFFLDN